MNGTFSNVYWIGGGSGAGKSTVAKQIAAKLDAHLYDTDAAIADHVAKSNAVDAPRLHKFLSMSFDERWIGSDPDEMVKSFHWFYGECFSSILDDIVRLPKNRVVVAEGFRLLPRLVLPILPALHHAIWLLPTPEFRRYAFEARGGLWDIPEKTQDPSKALTNLLSRDAKFTEIIKHDAKSLGLACLQIDGRRDADHTVLDLLKHFDLSPIK